MNSNITPEEAKKMIDRYRAAMPATALQSGLFNHDIIDFIAQNHEHLKMSGLRAYLAQDDKGQNTFILATTHHENGKDPDMKNGYFDLCQPCPVMCNTGAI